MAKTTNRDKSLFDYLGSFSLGKDLSAIGHLKLRGEDTQLRLHCDESLPAIESCSCLTGTAFTGECITLIDCEPCGMGGSRSRDGRSHCYADVFPHYVVIGRRHVDPTEAVFAGIHFSTADLATLFHDFEAFGTLIDGRPVIDDILRERPQMNPAQFGEHPIVQYFTGRHSITDVSTSIGRVFVHHQPHFNSGSPRGVRIRNRIVVSLMPTEPVAFFKIVEDMHDLLCFLSMAAGQTQGVKFVEVTTTEELNGVPVSLSLHPSHIPRVTNRDRQYRLHQAAVPLDPVRQPDEFANVLTDWTRRQPTWRIARLRYLDCLKKVNYYDSERLIAAANMFDILPPEATASPLDLPTDLAAARDHCVTLFRKCPPGIDRNSALSAMGRLGRPSLPKKVAHRASLIETHTEGAFPNLQMVVSTAVKCRNYLVHGNSDDIDYSKIESFVPFLTDALEFVFAASDFIDAGWNAKQGLSRGGGWGHSFARFRHAYSFEMTALNKALDN